LSLVRKFASVGGATMMSRVLGFAREALIAAALGAGPVTDAFYAAFRFPNLFRRLLAEGAFNTAFIPLFAKEIEGGGAEAARRFSEDVLAVLLTTLLALSAIAMLAMPVLVATVIAPGFADTPEKFDLTVVMGRIMFPYLLCMSLVAMFSGILNSLRRYFLAALVPVLLNVVLVGVLAVAMMLGLAPHAVGHSLAWGVFISGFAQLFVLAIAVWREGFALRFRLPRLTPGVRRLLVLMAPALVTGGVTQINLLIGQIIASAQDGAISILNYADRINQLPLGVIGIAVGVVLLPELSRAVKSGKDREVQHLQNRSLEFALGLTVPAAVGMVIMAVPIVNVLYERGAFTAETTTMTANALAAFAIGLPAYVLIKVFQPAFFAREDMKTPMWFTAVAVLVNIAFSLVLFPVIGHVGVALATSISAWTHAALLAAALWWREYFRPSADTLRRLALIIVDAALMGGIVWLLLVHLAALVSHEDFLVRLLLVSVIIATAALAYFLLVLCTGAIERSDLSRFLQRRRRA
jgi:putative peptidoglycan lipid II flippase